MNSKSILKAKDIIKEFQQQNGVPVVGETLSCNCSGELGNEVYVSVSEMYPLFFKYKRFSLYLLEEFFFKKDSKLINRCYQILE